MTTSGLIIMLFSIGTVVTMFSLCLYKIFKGPSDIHGVELKTPDIEEK